MCWDLLIVFRFVESILFIDVGKIPKNSAKSIQATLACRFTCVCIAHVL